MIGKAPKFMTVVFSPRPPRPRTRHRIPAVLGPLLLVLTAACGAGQQAQTADVRGGGNGSSAEVGHILLRNVYLDAEPDPQGPSGYGDPTLAFTAVNTSVDIVDRLVRIESEEATSVTIDADPAALELRPDTALAAGQPIEQLDKPLAPDNPITVRVQMADAAVDPGTAVPFTFVFERAGSVTFDVPFDVWTPGEPPPPTRPTVN
ncbi:hypothetical protein [Rhodococcus indonesiensis]|uniref:hypothetical protein n=1 Tax=Rhodococcus indonesiensis TaxID=3055869 RepID=UPI0039F6C4CD